ncbi:MAG: hypothetical protein PUK49_01370 [Oscillospiraceae bacterium]|nr:hypothetical protein [Oscillospiraceae bacterium]
MNYILCAVLWTESKAPPGYAATGIFSAKVCEGTETQYRSFLSESYGNGGEMLKDFLDFCGGEFMLCLWDGLSAGRIKKLLDVNGFRHPYVHLYHLQKVYELTEKKCRDIRKRRIMQTRLEKKPFYYGKRSAAENEVRWMVSVFELLDLSVIEKKPAIDFTEQPSNQYFVFKNGKCFHTKDCRIVKDASVSALRSYTYYAAAVDAGFTPCSRCKPENRDEQTAEMMRRINAEKQKEARAKHVAGYVPPKKKRKKPLNVYKSLAHMCGLYGLKFEKSGGNVFISSETGKYRIAPEDTPVKLYELIDDEYACTDAEFADPYQAVREIVRADEENGKNK